jgi:hypothetical protein
MCDELGTRSRHAGSRADNSSRERKLNCPEVYFCSILHTLKEKKGKFFLLSLSLLHDERDERTMGNKNKSVIEAKNYQNSALFYRTVRRRRTANGKAAAAAERQVRISGSDKDLNSETISNAIY